MRSEEAKFIIILTQDVKNISVQQIENSLKKNIDSNYQVLICDVNNVGFSGNGLLLNDSFFNSSSPIPFASIAFAITRTWSAIRSKSLAVSQRLASHGVSIINGCEFIEWSHSKIKQFKTCSDLFPKTVCFDAEFMKSTKDKKHDEIIQEVVATVDKNLQFPVVFKTDEGCRADGIFLVQTKSDLSLLMIKILSTPPEESKNGFLLQEFIITNNNPFISNYYRVNLVGGHVQSAVQFQMLWRQNADGFYKLSDFPDANDMPIDINEFPAEKLNAIICGCRGEIDCVGIDVVKDASGKLLLLEYNDGPVVSQIVSLGEKFLTEPVCSEAAAACIAFPDKIAKRCVSELTKKKQYSNSITLHST